MRQGDIGDAHGIEAPPAPNDDDNEIIIGSRGPQVGTGVPPVIMVKA